MEEVNVLERALGILKRQLSAEEFLTYLQTITPRIGDVTKELSDKTAGLSLQEVIQKAKELEEQSG